MVYDGTAYYGFQRQVTAQPTIQAAVERALTAITHGHITCIGAGRTDAGVHASGQVIAWDMEWQHPTANLLRAMNSHLPPDIALQSIAIAAAGFHPRFDATSRTYLYRLYIAPARDPLRDRYAWHRYHALNVETMAAAARRLEGEHDFATFGQPTQGHNTVRRVMAATMQHVGDEIHFTITANAFLQRMVRSLVGTLVDLGRGKMKMHDFEEAFLATDRSRSGPSAPPHGLILTHVGYATGGEQK